MYGVPPELFLDIYEHGVSDAALRRAGAPRHALHARALQVPVGSDEAVTVRAPVPDDFRAIWEAR